jgi:hypothetical protein
MIKSLREHANRANRDAVALRAFDDHRLLAHAVGGEYRDLRLIDDRRRDKRAEDARVRPCVGAPVISSGFRRLLRARCARSLISRASCGSDLSGTSFTTGLPIRRNSDRPRYRG